MRKRWARSCWESTQNKVIWHNFESLMGLRSDSWSAKTQYYTVLCEPERKEMSASLKIKQKMLLRRKHNASVNTEPSCSLLLATSPISVRVVPGRNLLYCPIQASTCNRLDFRLSCTSVFYRSVSFHWLEGFVEKPVCAVSVRGKVGLLLSKNLTMNVNTDRRGRGRAREGTTAVTFHLYFFQPVRGNYGNPMNAGKSSSLRQKIGASLLFLQLCKAFTSCS